VKTLHSPNPLKTTSLLTPLIKMLFGSMGQRGRCASLAARKAETRGGTSVSVPLQPAVPDVYFWGPLGLSPSKTGGPNGLFVVSGGSKSGQD
jgi:hypothetical protein